ATGDGRKATLLDGDIIAVLLTKFIKEVVGDAMADLLVVESLLRWYGFSIEDWEQSLYRNAPNVQIKVP
ncbi:hypothetical protein TELCIR_18701, partial [Teladorsagia circumcincta]